MRTGARGHGGLALRRALSLIPLNRVLAMSGMIATRALSKEEAAVMSPDRAEWQPPEDVPAPATPPELPPDEPQMPEGPPTEEPPGPGEVPPPAPESVAV